MRRTTAGLVFWGLAFWLGLCWSGQEEVIEPVGSGEINWSQGTIMAKGSGAPPKEAKNIAQARLMAERAALADARRNLLEVLKGVRVDSTTIVENFMVKSDEIRLQAEGMIQGSAEVRKLRKYLSDGAIEVTVAMNLSGDFMSLMITPPPEVPAAPAPPPEKPVPQAPLPSLKVAPTPPAPPKVAGVEKPLPKPEPPKAEPKPPLSELPPFTGLVVDARGLNMRAALIPKVLDEKGTELYRGQYVPPEKAAQSGLALYAKDLTAAQINPRVGKNPLTVKGLKVDAGKPSDIILSAEDTRRVAPFTQKGTFLEECKVMIVID